MTDQHLTLSPQKYISFNPRNDGEHWTDRLALRYNELAFRANLASTALGFNSLLESCIKAQEKLLAFEEDNQKRKLKRDPSANTKPDAWNITAKIVMPAPKRKPKANKVTKRKKAVKRVTTSVKETVTWVTTPIVDMKDKGVVNNPFEAADAVEEALKKIDGWLRKVVKGKVVTDMGDFQKEVPRDVKEKMKKVLGTNTEYRTMTDQPPVLSPSFYILKRAKSDDGDDYWANRLGHRYNDIAGHSRLCSSEHSFEDLLAQCIEAQVSLRAFDKHLEKQGVKFEESESPNESAAPPNPSEALTDPFEAAHVVQNALRIIGAWLRDVKEGKFATGLGIYERDVRRDVQDKVDQVLSWNTENGLGS
ncbi:hypothetical protein PRZ48_005303 [Zasmidium cellare]|uniref:Uncharacterized protein n=1 Tax=Zasmidium cellare TaxID=395010 RepID=A0ABR0ES94_ZASCE|nr:hypothetical protein PRZ48_005303 [Zasmidium cellare]